MSSVPTNRNRLHTDFTTGAVLPLLFRFMMPFLLANILNSVYNLVDTIIVGQFVGSAGIVAVNTGGKMLTLYTFLSTSFGGGGQIYISQIMGANRREELNRTIGTLFSEMLLLSVAFSVVTLLLERPILILLNTPEASFNQALSYMRITSAGLPLLFIYSAISSILRGMGDSRHPLIFIAIAAAANVVGDLVLIIGFDMGVTGTAIATVAGQGISVLFSLVYLYRRKKEFCFDFRPESFRVDREKFKLMFNIGWPSASRDVLIVATQMFLIGYVNLYGVVASAAYSIGDKFYHIANIFSNSVRQAGGSMVGQNISAGKHDRVVSIVHKSFSFTFGTSAVLCVVSLLLPKAIFRCFTSDPAVIAYAPSYAAVCCVIYILTAWLAPYGEIILGTGYTKLIFICGVLDAVFCRIGFSLLFAFVFNWGALGFFMGDALARLGTLIPSMIYYYSGAWRKQKKLIEIKED